jgi:pimeloyl-ACP methyl ester carboxylesterase
LIRMFCLLLAGACLAHGQLFNWGDRLSRSSKPPVLFITGHDAVCPSAASGETPFFNITFGRFDEVLARDGRASLVFEACATPNRPPIEDLAALLGQLLRGTQYRDGSPVTEIDVIAHSMGGLVLRAYLSSLAVRGEGPRVRKAVFIATPHFGTSVASPVENDPQLREMAPGSRFLFDLATWNQGRDDLLGVDAISIVGTAGKNGDVGFTDSVATLTSASVAFATDFAADNTIVLPLCHTFGGIGALLLCGGAGGLARVDDDRHPTARAALSFLNDSREWQAAGEPSKRNYLLSSAATVIAQLRDAQDQPVSVQSAKIVASNGAAIPLSISLGGLAYGDKLPPGLTQLTLNGFTETVTLRAGGGQALTLKPGPRITSVEPVTGAVWPLELASASTVRVRGVGFGANPVVSIWGVPVPVTLGSGGDVSIVLPSRISGVADLSVSNQAGRHTVQIFVKRSASRAVRQRR